MAAGTNPVLPFRRALLRSATDYGIWATYGIGRTGLDVAPGCQALKGPTGISTLGVDSDVSPTAYLLPESLPPLATVDVGPQDSQYSYRWSDK